MSTPELEITYVSHACLKIRGEFGTLLCDPWFLNEPVFNFSTWKFPAAVMPPEQVVEDVDFLYITHSHEDHFHVPSIDCFSRDVQVVLPEYENHPGLRAHTVERVMRRLGFHNIRKLRPWNTIRLNDTTPFTVIPSAASRSHDWENSGFVIEHPGCTLINMNDNLSDEALCAQISKRFPHLDIGFIQSAGVTMYPGCFRMSQEQMRAEAARRQHGFADQRRMMDLLRPDRIVPFAGDFCWLDDRYLHNNWANRGTPALFRRFLDENYRARNVELLVFYPSDTWSMQAGLRRNHPEIDWSGYLNEITRVKQCFQPRVDAIHRWIDDVPLHDLERRSRLHTERVQRWITRDYIDFDARFRIRVEGPHAGFSFVLKADPVAGFAIDWDDAQPVDQTLFVREHVWAAILEGKLMWDIVQWVAQAEQHVPYRLDIGRFWFWLELHVNLNGKNTQVILDERLYPHLTNRVEPRKGVFPLAGEWDRPWLKR